MSAAELRFAVGRARTYSSPVIGYELTQKVTAYLRSSASSPESYFLHAHFSVEFFEILWLAIILFAPSTGLPGSTGPC